MLKEFYKGSRKELYSLSASNSQSCYKSFWSDRLEVDPKLSIPSAEPVF